MGRPERVIDEHEGPVAAFALTLRLLRAKAGAPSYRALASRARYAPSVLSAATRGAQLPTWQVTEALVLACGGDPREWRPLWDEAARALRESRAASAQETVVARALPAASRLFTGRSDELTQILRIAGGHRAPATGPPLTPATAPGVIAVCAVDGMAGIGKTALCLQAAHELADRFPDGQLYVDLHGHTPGTPPREAANALEGLLTQLGTAIDAIPPGIDERAALYRSRLAARRVLVLLDNAADEDQIRPLLPGSGGCLALVTSRRRLKTLDDAHVLTLDVLHVGEAVELFRRAGGPAAAAASPAHATAVVRDCGLLPLAIVIAAALLRHRPAWTAAYLADKLRATDSGLHGFFDGRRDLGAAFHLSYEALPEPRQRLFRMLSLGGPDITAVATAALLEVEPAAAEEMLEDLVDHNLLGEPSAGRFRMHDLVRRHAHRLNEEADPPSERDAALRRLIVWYLHGAAAARSVLMPSLPAMALPPGDPAAPPSTFAGREDALAWCEAERANLVAAVDAAMLHGHHDLACLLPMALYAFFELRRHYEDWIGTHRIAIEAARLLGDAGAQGRNACNLGNAMRPLHRLDEAIECYRSALELFEQVGYRQGQGKALGNIASTLHSAGRFDDVTVFAKRALEIFRELGDRFGEALTLSNLGGNYADLGDYERAERLQSQALELFEAEQDAQGEARALAGLGAARLHRGDLAAAEDLLAQAGAMFAEVKDDFELAEVLLDQAAVSRALGRPEEAVELCTRALETYQRVGDTRQERRASLLLAEYRQAQAQAQAQA